MISFDGATFHAEYYEPAEVCKILNVSPYTLINWRRPGYPKQGPRYLKTPTGRIAYLRGSVEAFLKQSLMPRNNHPTPLRPAVTLIKAVKEVRL
jgi:hypothetical protein